MDPELRTSLERLKDAQSLNAAVRDACARFGSVTHLNILYDRSESPLRAHCFVKLRSEVEQRVMMTALGLSSFGDAALISIELPADFSGA